MRWTQWMQSRVLNVVLVAFLALPLGTPAVFAAYANTDEIRTTPARQSVDDDEPSGRERIEGEFGQQTPPPGAPPGYRGGPGGAWTGDAGFRTVDQDTGAYVHQNRFTSAPDLLAKLLPFVDLTIDAQGNTRLTIREGQKEALRPMFADLAYDAVIQTDPNVRESARWAIRELAPQMGVYSASARNYYAAMGRGEISRRTLPAFNLRWRAFDMARDLFEAAKAENAGAFLLEIAASEEGYTGLGHDYGGMAAEALAGAVAAGYEGPVFLKMDHTQINAGNYWKNPAAEIAALKAKITRGLEAGFMNVDLDSSTIELEPRYVELEVTQWLRDEIRSGGINNLFSETERRDIVDALTIPGEFTAKELKEGKDIRFNAALVDAALGRLADRWPGRLQQVFGWTAGQAEATLLNLRTPEARQVLQYEWDRLQQAESAKVFVELAVHTRKEAERIYGTRDIGLGAEVGEVGKTRNTTVSQVRAFLDLILEELRPLGIEGPNVFSVQSGAAHGGQLGPDGKPIRNVEVDWALLRAVSAFVRTPEYGYIAGSEQHGFSTVKEAMLSELPAHDAAEVHLATEYANMLLYGIILGEPILAGNTIYVERGTEVTDDLKWSLVNGAVVENTPEAQALFDGLQVYEIPPANEALRDQFRVAMQAEFEAALKKVKLPLTTTREQASGIYKDAIKRIAHRQPILQLMHNLPPELADANDDAWIKKFRVTFQRTNTTGTAELATQHAIAADPTRSPPPPLALARAIAQAEAAFVSNVPAVVTPTIARAATTAAAVILVAHGHRGRAKDKKDISAAGKAADADAKRTVERVIAASGERVWARGPEGIGRDGLGADAFEVAEVINERGFGPVKSGLIDVFEVTKGGVTNNDGKPRAELDPAISGSTSLFVQGPEDDSLGNISDNAYMDSLFYSVPPDRRQEFVDNPIRPDTEEHATILHALERIAEANNVTVNEIDLAVLDRPREQKRLAVFRGIQEIYPGLTISLYPDGTVNHSLLAAAGLKQDDRIKISWTVAAPVETAANLKLAKALRSHGAVGAFVVYSKNVAKTPKGGEAEQGEAKDLSSAFAFDESEQKDWVEFQGAERARWILEDHRLWTDADITDDVHASIPLVTDSGVLRLPGIRELGKGLVRVTSVQVQQEGDAEGHIWADVKDVNVAEVERTVAQGTFALQEPAAADPAVVDPSGNVLTLMKDQANPTMMVVHPSVAEAPGLFIAWQRALQQLQQEQGLKTVADAAKASSMKLVIQAERATPETAAELVNTINVASGGATQLTPEMISVVPTVPDGPITIAAGPQSWLSQASQAATSVVYEAPTEDTKVRSSASVLHAGAEIAVAARQGREPNPSTLAKLDTEWINSIPVVQQTSMVAGSASAFAGYQQQLRTLEAVRRGA